MANGNKAKRQREARDDSGLDEVENLFPGEVENATKDDGENFAAAQGQISEQAGQVLRDTVLDLLKPPSQQSKLPPHCGLCGRFIEYENLVNLDPETSPYVPESIQQPSIDYHRGCISLVLKQYHLGMFLDQTLRPGGEPVVQQQTSQEQRPWSSIALIQNTKREYHHEIKLYIDPSWGEEETERRLAAIQAIAKRLEQLDAGAGRVDVDPQDEVRKAFFN